MKNSICFICSLILLSCVEQTSTDKMLDLNSEMWEVDMELMEIDVDDVSGQFDFTTTKDDLLAKYFEGVSQLSKEIMLDRENGIFNSEAYFKRYNALYDLNRLFANLSLSDINHAILYDENNPKYYSEKSNLLRSIDFLDGMFSLDQSLVSISKAIELEPSNHSHYGDRGYVYELLGRTKEEAKYAKLAEADITKEIQLIKKAFESSSTPFPRAKHTLAEAYWSRASQRTKLANFEGACDDLNNAAKESESYKNAKKDFIEIFKQGGFVCE